MWELVVATEWPNVLLFFHGQANQFFFSLSLHKKGKKRTRGLAGFQGKKCAIVHFAGQLMRATSWSIMRQPAIVLPVQFTLESLLL